jgi:hypothetical protein
VVSVQRLIRRSNALWPLSRHILNCATASVYLFGVSVFGPLPDTFDFTNRRFVLSSLGARLEWAYVWCRCRSRPIWSCLIFSASDSLTATVSTWLPCSFKVILKLESTDCNKKVWLWGSSLHVTSSTNILEKCVPHKCNAWMVLSNESHGISFSRARVIRDHRDREIGWRHYCRVPTILLSAAIRIVNIVLW